jgi:hypothetical protein
MHLLLMNKKVSGRSRKTSDPVAGYLGSRGIQVAELPPDMLRELTRLLTTSEPAPSHESADSHFDHRETGFADKEHHREMLTFEMYLAAWIAMEGICNRPRRRKKRRAVEHPTKTT